MGLSYEPLWKMLEQLNISKMEFARQIDISNATLAKLGKNEPVTLTTIDKICDEFNCGIDKVVEHVSNNNKPIIFENELVPGTIVLSSCYPLGTDAKTNVLSSPSLKIPCVILKKFHHHYLIAPISYKCNPETIIDLEFHNLKINDTNCNGYILLGKMGHKTSDSFEKILGKVPNYYIETIDTHLKKLKPILSRYPNIANTIDNFLS